MAFSGQTISKFQDPAGTSVECELSIGMLSSKLKMNLGQQLRTVSLHITYRV